MIGYLRAVEIDQRFRTTCHSAQLRVVVVEEGEEGEEGEEEVLACELP